MLCSLTLKWFRKKRRSIYEEREIAGKGDTANVAECNQDEKFR